MEMAPAPNGRVRYPHHGAPVSQRCNSTEPTFNESASDAAIPTFVANSTPRLTHHHSNPGLVNTSTLLQTQPPKTTLFGGVRGPGLRAASAALIKLMEAVRDVDTGSARPGDVFRGLLRLT